jgi:hypothetical protein
MIQQQKSKDWEKRKRQMENELRTLSDYIKIAQQVFNTFIRKRDINKNCISCDTPLGIRKHSGNAKFDAGHYFNANNHWSVRFHESNVHGQCVHCNQHLHGNLIPYRENLIKRIGMEEFKAIEAISKETRNYTIPEVIEIINTYKKRLKNM